MNRHQIWGLAPVIFPIWLGGAALLVASCSSPHVRRALSEMPQPIFAAAPAVHHLEQLNYGPQAEFGRCAPPACPSITPKTLATAPSAKESLPIRPSISIPDYENARPSKAIDPVPDSPSPTGSATKKQALPLSKTATVYFDFGNASLTQAAQEILLGAMVGATEAPRITVVGRTDSTGPSAVNDSLAAARARAVKDFLRARYPGVGEILIGNARGSCCYAAPNDSVHGRRLNRRVEVAIGADESPRP